MKSFALASVAILCLTLAAVSFALAHFAAVSADKAGKRLDSYATVIGERLDARDKQIAIALGKMDEYVTVASADARANTDTIAYILRDVAEMTHTINTKILPDVADLLQTIKASLTVVDSIRADVHTLSATAGADLESLKVAIDNAATLLASLDKAVRENSPEVSQLADAAEKAINDLDKLLADPNVSKTIGHVEGISDSTDQIFKEMAKKAGLLKTVLRVIVQAVHVTFYRPF